MYAVSADYLELVTAPVQVVVVTCAAYLGDVLLAGLSVTGGSVSADSRRAIMRTAEIEFAPDALRTHSEVYDLLCTPGLELAPQRGFLTPAGDILLAPLGRFIVDEVSLTHADSGTTVTVECSDVSARIQRARWTETFTVEADTALITALTDLISDRWPGARMAFDAGAVPETVSAAAVFDIGEDSDPWNDGVELASALGYTLYADPLGTFRLLRPPDPSTAQPVFAFARGATAIITQETRKAPLETAYNGVIAIGEGSSLACPIRGEAWDEDPASPTYRLGPFGEHPKFYSSSLLTDSDQAETAAVSQLAKVLGRVEQLSWEQAANAALEPLDAVSIEQADGTRPIYVIDQLEVPLSATEAMTATARETTGSY